MRFTNEAALDWLNAVVEEIGRAQIVEIVQAAALWGILGGGFGLAVSFGAYRGFRHLRWYGATSAAGRWSQRGVFVVVTLISTGLFGAAGLWEGIRQQCQSAVTRSQLGRTALPGIADLIADGLVWVDLAADRGDSAPKIEFDTRLKAFRANSWELDAPAFLQRVDALRAGVFQEILDEFARAVIEETPSLQGGAAGKLLHHLIRTLGHALLEEKLSAELRRKGADQLYHAIRDRLIAEAARTGNPVTIGRAELSGFLLRDGIIPAIVAPIRSFARQQQIAYGFIALVACLAPPLLCRAGQKIFRHPPDNGAARAQ